MTNAEMAVELVVNYLESENIIVGTREISKKVDEWEKKLNPIDFISLAAIVLEDPNKIALTNNEIRKIREFYFPSENFF